MLSHICMEKIGVHCNKWLFYQNHFQVLRYGFKNCAEPSEVNSLYSILVLTSYATGLHNISIIRVLGSNPTRTICFLFMGFWIFFTCFKKQESHLELQGWLSWLYLQLLCHTFIGMKGLQTTMMSQYFFNGFWNF